MVFRAVAAVWLLALLAGCEYLDRRYHNVYQGWTGLRDGCFCNPDGSASSRCDIRTRQCTCLPHVTGLSCDRCQAGYFDLRPGVGCRRCDCDRPGSVEDACDPVTGRCLCKPGVGGARCTACLPGFFWLSDMGCLECGPCDMPGRRCDPDTGQCACPPHTEGAACQRCARGYWGHNPTVGCQSCDCDRRGSNSTDCDPVTGQCSCIGGFRGRRCDQCALGFRSFPSCRRCFCDPAGTEGCDSRGNCPCDDDGRCRCKKNVRGSRCSECAPDTFGLSADNPHGCTECYCFTRSGQCSQADFSWVPLTLPDERAVTLVPGQTRLNVTNSLRVIPGQSGDVTLGLSAPLDAPVYWQLPEKFLGDRVRSYNGQLRFRLLNSGGSRPFPASVLATYPLVQLQGNDRLVLEYFPQSQQPSGADGLYQVKFHEALWRRKGDSWTPVTREMLMVALQNTQHVLIRATEAVDTQRAEISDISWDVAEPTMGHPSAPALGIELCGCPSQYNGSSCQDPSIGFFRTYTREHHRSQIIIDLIGDVTECQCNGRAPSCDPETGFCQNCTENSAGRHCDVCADGFYGDPSAAGCRRCLCPTAGVSNARSCTNYYGNTFRCQCKPGYYGERCDRCDYGYYGDALDPSAGCVPCACDPAGSVGRYCDPVSGQCRCRAGLLGRDCTSCPARHALTTYGCQACRDGCVEVLFEELDQLTAETEAVNMSRTVGAPWQRLYAASNATEHYQQQFDDYVLVQRELRAMSESLDLDKFADNLLTETEELLNSLLKTNDTQELQNEIQAILESVLDTRADAEETVENLLKYARGETPSASLEQALAEVTAILEELQKRDFTAAQERAESELAEALRLRERIEGMATNGTAQAIVGKRIEDVRQRLQDMLELIEKQARQPVRQANVLLDEVQGRLDALAGQQRRLDTETRLTKDLLTNVTDLQHQLRQLYDQAQGHSIDLGDLRRQLDLSNASMQERLGPLSELDDDFRRKYVIPAEIHAEKLRRQAASLAGAFQATRLEANMSLAAATAYQEIVDALEAARQAALEAGRAAQRAYDQAYPRDTDSLVSLGTQTKVKSERLLKLAGELNDQVSSLSGKLAASKRRLQQVNETMRDARARNDVVRRQLEALNITGLSRAVSDATETARASQAKSNAVSARVDAVLSGLDSQLRPGLQRLENVSRGGVDGALDTVAGASEEIRRAAQLVDEVEAQAASTGQLADDMDLKLQHLRNKILKARQAASSIRVSLTSVGPSCTRRYRPVELQPSTTSSLWLSYAISSFDTVDALLLYVAATGGPGAASAPPDFMAVEMVSRQIRFLWNNGGGTQEVVHPLKLKVNDEQLLSDKHWYIIEADRIGNIGRLSVRPVSQLKAKSVSNASAAGFSVMDLTADDPVYIGAPPATSTLPLTAQRFAGCLGSVSINGQQLGLWNFQSNRDCGACRVSPSDDGLRTETSESSFDGAGYVELPPLPRGRGRPNFYTVGISVRTFDADALLFLVFNAKGQFFSLEMRNGHLVMRVGFSDKDVLVVKSNEKYNTGNWTDVEATQFKYEVLLKVNNGDGTTGVFNPVSGGRPSSSDLDLDESKLYVGGVPPDFDRSRWPQLTFVPLLGCVRDLQVVIPIDLKNLRGGNSTGVSRGCGTQLLKTVSFHDDGYLETGSYRLRKSSSFEFSFKTDARNGLLLISTFAGKVTADSADLQEYYALALKDGNLVLKINGGIGELVLTANGTFNDNVFHTVQVLKQNRGIKLRVADREVASGALPRGSAKGSSSVQVPAEGGLFLGGLPTDVKSPVKMPRSFRGCITDVILEDRLVLFDEPLRHERAAIGRCDTTLPPHGPRMATEPLAPTRCHQRKQVTLEDRALKFGDDPYSHVFQQVSKKEFDNDFTLSVNFRTFYPNGLLIYNERGRGSAYFMLTLRNGAVVLNAARGARTLELSTQQRFNDGRWKSVTLEVRGRKYTLRVDDDRPVSKRGRFRLKAGNGIYVGGLPTTSYGRGRPLGPERLEYLQTEGFKGCMRQLGVRDRVYDLTLRQKTSFKVGQCSAHVEQGTFFAGDAHATYDDSFQWGDEVNLAVDFRTSALDGVLISMAGPPDGRALALEIADGQVVFSVRNGAAKPIRARMKFATRFAVCDNQWHSVKAHYIQNQARLRVDKYPETYGVTTATQRAVAGRFPLYIGGLPYSPTASNSILLKQDNFKGCLRNIEINKVRRDWTDMAQLSNVLLNSCPVEK